MNDVKTAFYAYLTNYREQQRPGQLVMNAYYMATGMRPQWLPDVWDHDTRTTDVEKWYEAFHMTYVSNH